MDMLSSIIMRVLAIITLLFLSSCGEDSTIAGNIEHAQQTAYLKKIAASIGCSYSKKEGGNVSVPDVASTCNKNSGKQVNLDSHDGMICERKGDLFDISFTTKPDTKVQIGVCDEDGNLIKDALMMWQKPEMVAKRVDDVVTFENVFISMELPYPFDAQLRIAGAKNASNNKQYLAFDLSEELPPALFNRFSYRVTILESNPSQYRWKLGYGPEELKVGDKVDWYIFADADDDSSTPRVSKIMQTEVTSDNYKIVDNDTNPSLLLSTSQPDENGDPLLRKLPSCPKLVSKVSRGASVSIGVGIRIGCAWQQ